MIHPSGVQEQHPDLEKGAVLSMVTSYIVAVPKSSQNPVTKLQPQEPLVSQCLLAVQSTYLTFFFSPYVYTSAFPSVSAIPSS